MKGYFVDRDAHGNLWVWRENGDLPIPVLSQQPFLRGDGALWDAIVAMVEGPMDRPFNPYADIPVRDVNCGQCGLPRRDCGCPAYTSPSAL